MELQRTQQQVLTKTLVAILLATSCFSGQETRAISLFSTKPAVVAPATSGLVDFVRENQDLTVFASIVLAGVISYAIYQRWFAPKTPISRILQMNKARFDADLLGLDTAFKNGQIGSEAIHAGTKHLHWVHEDAIEGLSKALIDALEYDEWDAHDRNCMKALRQLVNERMLEFEAALQKHCCESNAIDTCRKIVNGFSNVLLQNKLIPQEKQNSCLFLEAALQEYADLFIYMTRENRRNSVKIKAARAALIADAAQHPKEEATEALRVVRSEQEDAKKLAEAQKSSSQNVTVDIQHDVAYGFLISVNWARASVEDVFKRARAQFQALQNLFPAESQEHALLVEEAVRGSHGIFPVIGAVLAHKICEIVCGSAQRIEKGLYEELFGMLRTSEIKAFNNVSFDFAREGLRDAICQKLGQVSARKEQQDALMALLIAYRDFIREVRVQLDAYLTACKCTSNNGSPCKAAFESRAYEDVGTPLLNWPYIVVETKRAPVTPDVVQKKPGALRIKRDDEVSEHYDAQSESSRFTIPQDWSSAPAFSSASCGTSNASATRSESMGVWEEFVMPE